MAFETTKENKINLSGDAELKELDKQKSEIILDIRVLGAKLEEMQAQLESYSDLSEKNSELKLSIDHFSSEVIDLSRAIKQLSEDKFRLESEIKKREEKIKEFEDISLNIEKANASLSTLHVEIKSLDEIKYKKENNLDEELESILVDINVAKVNKEGIERELNNLKNESQKLVDSNKDKTDIIQKFEQRIIELSDEIKLMLERVKTIGQELFNLKKEKESVVLGIQEEKEKALDDISILQDSLNEKELELQKREGDVSVRQDMLDSRATYLKNAKARLENYLGKQIDLIIE